MYQVTITWKNNTKTYKSKYDWHNITKLHILSEDNGMQKLRSVCTRWYKKLKDNTCEFCHFEGVTEMCHIVSISDADDFTTIAELHSPENLLELCPTCHKLFDNNMIDFNKLPRLLKDKVLLAGNSINNYVSEIPVYDWSHLRVDK